MRIILLLFILYSTTTWAQKENSRTALESRRKNILENIKETQQQLAVTRTDKNASLTELRVLQKKLAERQKLISNINQEINAINNNIHYSEKEIDQLRNRLNMLKMRYAQSVRYAYKNRSSYNMLAFIFSAESFNTAMRRMRYLQKYREYRKHQADQIRVMNDKIEQKIDVLNLSKSKKNVLRSAEERQKQVIQKETNEKDKVVASLKGREKELTRDIAKNQRALKKLEVAISAAIKREIEIARKKAEEERKRQEEIRRKEEEARLAAAKAAAEAAAKQEVKVMTGSGAKPAVPGNPRYNKEIAEKAKEEKEEAIAAAKKTTAPAKVTPPPLPKPVTYNLSLTPEVAALSDNFESNKGKLPWPVEKGFITERYGRVKHPVYNIETENNGIEIQTNPNAGVRAVFNGEVKNVFYVPGMGQCVLIDHGRFFTVYSRLGKVNVSKGSKVSMKQNIGTVGANDNGEYLMHFELWKVSANDKSYPQDPSGWIAN